MCYTIGNMHRRLGLIILLLFMGILVNSTYCWAETIKLVTGEWPPYTTKEREGYGVITEILSEVFEEMDIEPEYEFYSWEKCYTLVKQGEVWAAFPYAYTEERAKEVLFSETIGESTTRFFYYKIPPAKTYEILEDLQPYKIVGVKGYFYKEDFQQASLNVTYLDNETQALQKLFAGEADLMPLNELVGWALIKDLFPDNVDEFGTLETPYNVHELKLIVSKDYPESNKLLKQFNKALKRFKNSKYYNAILRKYGLRPQRLQKITW